MINLIVDDLDKINVDISSLKNNKILVTGASGLVGLYIVSYLKKFKAEFNLDIHTWTKNPIEKDFSEVFDDTKNIIGDITDPSLFEILDNYDFIIHASGYGQPLRFLDDKIKTIEINTTSTIQLFKKLNPGGKFLFISSSEIYSGNDSLNIDEDSVGTTNTFHPRSCYIEGKRTGESICFTYSDLGYNVKIARLCLAYGPGTKKFDQRVLNSLVQKSILEDNINLLDSGSSIRTYCYITDVVEMLLNISMFGEEVVYNIGGESRLSIMELAQIIGKLTNKKVLIPQIDNPITGNPNVVNISVEKYCKEFKKRNFINLNDGLLNTINWQKKLYLDEKN